LACALKIAVAMAHVLTGSAPVTMDGPVRHVTLSLV